MRVSTGTPHKGDRVLIPATVDSLLPALGRVFVTVAHRDIDGAAAETTIMLQPEELIVPAPPGRRYPQFDLDCPHPGEYLRMGDHPDARGRWVADDIKADVIYCLRCEQSVPDTGAPSG